MVSKFLLVLQDAEFGRVS